VKIGAGRIVFEFRGKSGIQRRVHVEDPALARIVQHCADMPGQELFQWIDNSGRRHRVGSADVNHYLRTASDGPFTAKDFRTWHATIQAMQLLRRCRVGNARSVKREVSAAIVAIAARLGNTPAICRKSYVHPEVLVAYAEGKLSKLNGCSAAVALRQLLSHGS
jgi:DNA topoisomerase-1